MSQSKKNVLNYLIILLLILLILIPVKLYKTSLAKENDDLNHVNDEKNEMGKTVLNSNTNDEEKDEANSNENSDINSSDSWKKVLKSNRGLVGLENIDADYYLNAVLYDTVQYSGGTGTELTEDGAEINNWEFNTSKYLQIVPRVPADGKNYKIKVVLPQEMYIVGSELAVPSGFSDVEFQKNDAISVNGGMGTYNLKDLSGTATYTLNYMGISGTIQLELRYDNTIWDKQANSSITPEGIRPIIVELIKEENDIQTIIKQSSVSKITAGSKLDFGGTLYYDRGSQIQGEIEVLLDNRVGVFYTYSSNDGYNEKTYVKKLYLDIDLPTYTDGNGIKHYLEPDDSTIVLDSMLTSYNYEIDKSRLSTEGKYIIIVRNAYFNNTARMLTFYFKQLDEELSNADVSEFPYVYNAGLITVYGDTKNGNEHMQLTSRVLPKITIYKEIAERVTLFPLNYTASILNRPVFEDVDFGGAISEFGGAQLSNLGTGDSVPKTVKYEFDTENTGKIHVTTVNIISDLVQKNIDIKYTLVDEYGNRVFLDEYGNRVEENAEGAVGEWTYSLSNIFYNKNNLDNLNNTFARSNLQESHQKYYFKTVEYYISKIKATARLYATGGNKGYGSAGNFFGYISDSAINNEKFYTRVTVSSNDSAGTIEPLIRTITTTTSNIATPSYMLQSISWSKSSIIAGESVNVSGTIGAYGYPYGNCNWFNNIRLGVVLPVGVTINDQSINMITSANNIISDIEIERNNLNNGKILWILKCPSDVNIGYANENLAGIKTGTNIRFSMQLDTSYVMNTVTMFAKEALFLAGYNQTNAASGALNWASAVDIYDLNSNGSTTDKIGGVSSSNNVSCQIISQNAMLDITDSVLVTINNVTIEDENKIAMINRDDVVTYKLSVNSASGGQVPEFDYYIPIPKTSSVSDGFLIETNDKKFDLSLKEAVSFSGSDLFNVKYAVKTGLTYTSAQSNEEWYTAEEIETSDTIDFEDVTMIKLTAKVEGIQNGDMTELSAKLKYSGNSFYEEAGMKNIWHSGGYYVHVNGDRETAGNYSTKGITVTISCNYLENDDVVLTAAPNREPKQTGNVIEFTVDKSLFPNFKNAQTFRIENIETYNVTLQTKEYMNANIEMAGIDANKTFGVTVSLNGGSEINIVNIEGEEKELGTNPVNTAPEFKFTIYNANKISDNSTSRYIILTLLSDNGVKYKQKIVINRELEKASDPKSAIISGKSYIAFDDITEEITVSGDSAFTSQIVTSYIPSTYGKHILNFGSPLAKGTAIVLANITYEDSPKYYYYKSDGSTKDIDFTKFIKIGTTGTKDYTYYSGAETVDEKLLFIVDLSKAESGYNVLGTNTINMTIEGNGIENVVSKELRFNVTDIREFDIELNKEEVKFDEELDIKFITGGNLGTESKYEGRKTSLVLKMPDNIPTDTILRIENNTSYSLNGNKEFIVQLGDVEEKEETLKAKFISNMLPESGKNYSFKAQLWISATANGTKPLLGEKVAEGELTLKAEKKIKPSLKVKNMSKRAIKTNELNEEIDVNFKYIKDGNLSVTIELAQKAGIGYQKVTDKLSKVGNNTTHNMGVFDISPQNGDNSIKIKLSSSTGHGTYRFIFRVKDEEGKELIEVPYNFMVVEP